MDAAPRFTPGDRVAWRGRGRMVVARHQVRTTGAWRYVLVDPAVMPSCRTHECAGEEELEPDQETW